MMSLFKRPSSSLNGKVSSESTSTVSYDEPHVSIHPLPSQEGVILTVDPPKSPQESVMKSHVPCDIVLVIDVSDSMTALAPAAALDNEGKTVQENGGFTVLDLAKHAALTILETLNENDRLGIVTFSNGAKTVQKLFPMTASNKKFADSSIRRLRTESATNLWQGILDGLKLFKDDTDNGRVPAMLVLTDGMPNTQNPVRGFVPALRDMLPLPAAIHMFGFGYHIESGLLKGIAEIGGGNYAFIPDSNMIGTVFVNAVAHLQSTFANKCTLEVTYPECLGSLEITTGETADQKRDQTKAGTKLTINLGNLQFGQSRDVYLRYSKKSDIDSDDSIIAGFEVVDAKSVVKDEKTAVEEEKDLVTATLKYSLMHAPEYVVSTRKNLLEATDMPAWEIAYHQSRSMVCEYLASFSPIGPDGAHKLPNDVEDPKLLFRSLVNRIPAQKCSDEFNKSLMDDLVGQIKMAIWDDVAFSKWGRHYFLSLWDAHSKQFRNNFKDIGVQMYNANSPLFLKCQDELMTAFDTKVKPPEPSQLQRADFKYSSGSAKFSMACYSASEAPCFAASSLVSLAAGKQVPISRLRRGMAVQTTMGSRRVVCLLKTKVQNIILCQVGDLLVTAWHPIIYDGKWVFPVDVADRAVRFSGAVYSVLLQPDQNVDAHNIQVCGFWGVTLGHGLTEPHGDEDMDADVRAHPFLGDYRKVFKALLRLGGPGTSGVVKCGGVTRSKKTEALNGFKKAQKSIRL